MTTNAITAFRVGELYTNDQVRFALALENLGGIRPSVDAQHRLRHVAIMTAAEESGRLIAENPYRDRIEEDILLYTAQGREGDQQLAGRNKRLIEQYSNPAPFYGFMNMGHQTYRFLGLLELIRHYRKSQADRRGALRQVWLFEFRIHAKPELVPIDQAATISAALLAESCRDEYSALEREVANETSETEQVSNIPLETEILRSRMIQIPPYRFEHLIKSLMESSGFRDVTVTSASGDGGVDLNAYAVDDNDFFAGTHVQTQVKRWRHAVGSVEINNFRGALSPSAKGVFITTSHYTRAAIMEARHPQKLSITLINGDRLAAIVQRTRLNIDSFL
jgi:restriction system protein